MLSNIKRSLSKLLSNDCILCDTTLKDLNYLCEACFHELPWITHACHRCGQELLSPHSICGKCILHPQAYHAVIAPFRYQKPINLFIATAKFHDKLYLCELLGQLLLDKLQSYYARNPIPELILPIPLHTQRLRTRGFNQALEIAKPISQSLAIKIDYKSVKRIKATLPQTEIQGNQRKTNIKNAFAFTSSITAKHVAVIDDVITTGHTMEEFCQLLKKQGVEKIDVWCCAKTHMLQ